MDEAEKELIRKNLSDLVIHTMCNEVLLAFMQENDVLSFSDIDNICAKPADTAKAKLFYDTVQTRTNAFPVLLEGLQKSNQQHIVQLLSSGRLPDEINIQQRTDQRLGKSTKPILFDVHRSDAWFTGRRQELTLLHNKVKDNILSSDKMNIIIVSGLGGIGKTELCRKYVEIHKKEFRDTVIWINAETDVSLTKSFAKLATETLKISAKNVDGAASEMTTIVDNVYKHLEKRRCLFVFDNVEHGEYLRPFLPLNRVYPDDAIKPTIIMTSREVEWDMGRDDSKIEVMKLFELDDDDAVEMVRYGLRDQHCPGEDILKLAKRLQCFPLAMRQAISYILEQRVLDYGYAIQDYLDKFELNRKEMLLKNSKKGTTLTNDYSETTFTTWTMTMNKICPPVTKPFSSFRRTKGDAELISKTIKHILSCVAYIEPDAISIGTLKRLVGRKCTENIFQESLRKILRYSMISGNDDNSVFNVHRLVQDVVKINTTLSKHQIKVMTSILQTLSPREEMDDVDHAMAAWRNSDNLARRHFLRFPCEVAQGLIFLHRYIDSNKFCLAALEELPKITAEDAPWVLSSIRLLGATYNLKFVFSQSLLLSRSVDEALKIFYELLESYKNVCRLQRISTFRIHHQIGICLGALKRYDEAIFHMEKARDGFLRSNGSRTDIADVECSLAAFQEAMGNKSESQMNKRAEVYRKCYEVFVEEGNNNGAINAGVALGKLLQQQGKYSEAITILSEVEKREREFLGDKSAEYSDCSKQLVSALGMQGRDMEIMTTILNRFQVRKELDEKDQLGTCLHLFATGKYDECFNYAKTCYDSYVNDKGMDETSDFLLSWKFFMGGLLIFLNKPGEAVQIYKFILANRNSIGGPLSRQQNMERKMTDFIMQYENYLTWENCQIDTAEDNHVSLFTRENLIEYLENCDNTC